MSNFQQPPSYHYPEQGQPTTSQQSYYQPQKSYEQTQGGYYQQQQPYYPPPAPSQGQKPMGSGVSAATLGPDGAPTRAQSPKIVSKPKYNDVWATILFVMVFLSFVGLAIVGIGYGKDNIQRFLKTTNGDTVLPFVYSFVVAIMAGVIISTIYFFMMQSFAGKMIIASGIIMILLNLALAIYFMFTPGGVLSGILLLLFTLLYAFVFYSWRHRIPFAKVMLKTVTSITGQFPATLFSGFIGLVFEIIFIVAWVLTISGFGLMYNDQKMTQTGLTIVILYLVFSFYWIAQVIKNIVHVTVCGLFASYYFYAVPNPSRPGKNKLSVRNPTAKSAGRALSTSFGSICYGSLIIALIQTLRYMIRTAAQSAADDGNVCAVFCLYCLDCCMAMIEGLAEYFNHYAFTQVAIYGKDYCTAGKDTWTLIKSRGIDAIINDDLISNVLGLGSLLCGILCAAAGGLFLRNYGDGFDQPEMMGTVVLVAVMCMLIGATEFAILAEVIFSGLAATFVCMAEDPGALQRTKPLLYQKVVEVYPQVMSGL